MSFNKNFVLLFVSSLLLSACAEDNKFPELRASQNVSEDKIYEEEKVTASEELIEVDISENLSNVAVDEEGTVIIAVANPNPEEAKEETLKIKPILKKKTDDGKGATLRANRSPSSIKLYDVSEEISEEANNVTIDNNVLAEVQVASAQGNIISETPQKISLVDTIYFGNGGSSLKNEDRSKIKKIVKLAKEKKATVYVLGYSSSRTSDTDYVTHKMANFKVSLDRAETVSDALIKGGLKSDKVLVEALSDARPAYLEVMPEGERLNRRVEIYVGY